MTNSEPGASPQRPAGNPWWKHLGKWFAALLGPVIVGVAVAWITGVFEEHPPRPPKLTVEKYLRPFSDDGRLEKPYRVTRRFQTGECPGPSYLSSDPEALRCGAGSYVLDPCWTWGWEREAACFNTPWDHKAWAITNPRMTNAWASADKSLPWALEIRDPTHKSTLHCTAASGAADFIAGMRRNWYCTLPGKEAPYGESVAATGYALGDITRSLTKPWSIPYAANSSSEVLKADIITVWH